MKADFNEDLREAPKMSVPVPMDPEPSPTPVEPPTRPPFDRIHTTFDLSSSGQLDVMSNETYRRVDLMYPSWVGLHHDQKTLLEGFRISDFSIVGARKWGSRMYRVKTAMFRDGAIEGVLVEHGMYHNLAGGPPTPNAPVVSSDDGILYYPQVALLYEDLYFENIASQAMQFVTREGETPNVTEDFRAAGIHVVRDVDCVNIGQRTKADSERASFALTFFGARNPLELSKIKINNTKQASSRGFFLIQGYWNQERGNPGASGKKLRRPYATLSDFTFAARYLEQPAGQTEDLARLKLQDGEFWVNGGNNVLSLQNLGLLEIDNVYGDTQVVMNGRNLGAIKDLRGSYE